MNNLKTKHSIQKPKTIAQQVAEICGCSTDYVYKVLRGENSNMQIEATYKKILEAQQVGAEMAKQKLNLNS